MKSPNIFAGFHFNHHVSGFGFAPGCPAAWPGAAARSPRAAHGEARSGARRTRAAQGPDAQGGRRSSTVDEKS